MCRTPFAFLIKQLFSQVQAGFWQQVQWDLSLNLISVLILCRELSGKKTLLVARLTKAQVGALNGSRTGEEQEGRSGWKI